MGNYKVMFLCTGNSCRSQMAEGLAKHLSQGNLEVYSAGVEAHGVNPLAIEVMQEIGVDISNQKSELINPNLVATMDYVITLCGDARERCPVIPAQVKVLHWPFPDPAKVEGNSTEIRAAFRSVRDGLASKITNFLHAN